MQVIINTKNNSSIIFYIKNILLKIKNNLSYDYRSLLIKCIASIKYFIKLESFNIKMILSPEYNFSSLTSRS